MARLGIVHFINAINCYKISSLTMATLITVPTITVNQGDPFNQEELSEKPVHVDFYDGSIVLRQDGDYKQQEEILISPKYFEAIFKEIRKHLPKAIAHHSKK